MKQVLVILLFAVSLGGCHQVPQNNILRQQICGGYTSYRPVTEKDLAVFEQYYTGEEVLTPFEVATQVVAGINYRFRCHSLQNEVVEVVLFVPLPCNEKENEN